MPINTPGLLYSKRQAEWKMIQDLLDGEKTIKDAGETYLPKLKAQDVDSYENYKARGYLYDAVDKTRGGFLGAIMRKPVSYDVPAVLEPFMSEITLDKNSFNVLVSDVLDNLISSGFYGALADVQQLSIGSPKPYVSTYGPLNIINCFVS